MESVDLINSNSSESARYSKKTASKNVNNDIATTMSTRPVFPLAANFRSVYPTGAFPELDLSGDSGKGDGEGVIPPQDNMERPNSWKNKHKNNPQKNKKTTRKLLQLSPLNYNVIIHMKMILFRVIPGPQFCQTFHKSTASYYSYTTCLHAIRVSSYRYKSTDTFSQHPLGLWTNVVGTSKHVFFTSRKFLASSTYRTSYIFFDSALYEGRGKTHYRKPYADIRSLVCKRVAG